MRSRRIPASRFIHSKTLYTIKFPISLFRKLGEVVDTLDKEGCYSGRHLAIRETALLLISLAHDEYYNIISASDKKYDDIIDACHEFVGE